MRGSTGTSMQGRAYVKKEKPISCDCQNCGNAKKKRVGGELFLYCNRYEEWKPRDKWQGKNRKRFCRFYYKAGTL